MKLYTEEQVRTAIDLARITLADKSPYPKYIILSEIKGIELPSDEEIIDNAPDDTLPLVEFIAGAKWMRDKILKNK